MTAAPKTSPKDKFIESMDKAIDLMFMTYPCVEIKLKSNKHKHLRISTYQKFKENDTSTLSVEDWTDNNKTVEEIKCEDIVEILYPSQRTLGDVWDCLYLD